MDSSSTPWRVFDSPGTTPGASPAGEVQVAGTGSSGTAGATGNGLPANPVVAIAGIGAAVVVGALAILIALTSSGAGTVAGPETSFETGGTAVLGGSGEIVVDVAGAVVAPGVYHLAAGSRIGEAIDAAGGFGPRVDAARVSAELNLAATLQDGAQVRVPSRDETPPPNTGGGGSGGGGGAAGVRIDLNTASQTELESLPGIGPVTATKILESRATAPFTSVQELRDRGLVGEATFADIEPLVSVG